MIGQLLTGRYLILKQLGEGGFSKTYLAIDKYLLNQPVCVVKCLKSPINSTISIEKVQQLFEAEARSLDRLGLRCEKIPTLLAFCHEQNNFYLVEEYVKGEDLEVKFNRGRYLSAKESIELLKEILQILEYVHQHEIIHCDIKPSNLIQRESHDVVLIDFGAARESRTGQNKQAEDHPLTIGTFGYMPEEQKNGCPQFNSDLYALGVSVIQLLTGMPPGQLRFDSASGELNWHSYLPQQSIDPRLISILDQMVRRDHRLRYQSATEVTAALQALSLAESHPQRRRSRAKRQRPTGPTRFFEEIWQPMVLLLSVMTLGGGCYLLLSQDFSFGRQAEATPIQKALQLQTAAFQKPSIGTI